MVLNMEDQIDELEKFGRVKGFKLVHLNVRGLMKKMDQLRILLHDSRIARLMGLCHIGLTGKVGKAHRKGRRTDYISSSRPCWK